jgi:class 3 adenylate cyclase
MRMIGKTENLTVMFTDIVNYTKITSEQSRVESAAMLAYHDRLLLPIVAAYGGRRVK